MHTVCCEIKVVLYILVVHMIAWILGIRVWEDAIARDRARIRFI